MTLLITVTGAVQGVGYRPFVAELARKTGIRGTVRNRGGIVEITAEGEEAQVASFRNLLRSQSPPGARVLRIADRRIPDRGFSEFRIAASGELPDGGDGTPIFPPDLPTCGDCLREMHDPADRRYRYPLISCASCGPRFSILDKLPYDRENTVMSDFPMCGPCAADYREGRRRHAQTVSCRDCGPQLLFRGRGVCCEKEEALAAGAGLLRSGGVLALKGVGGYQFLCSPYSPEAVGRLRALKGREKKPFAVLFPSVESVREVCRADPDEERLLRSEARPIVLLRRRSDGEPLGRRVPSLHGAPSDSDGRMRAARRDERQPDGGADRFRGRGHAPDRFPAA